MASRNRRGSRQIMATEEDNRGLMAVILVGGAAALAFILLKGSGSSFVPAHGFSLQPVDPPQPAGSPRRWHFSWVPATSGVMYLDISTDSVFPNFVGKTTNGQSINPAGIIETGNQDVVPLSSGIVYFCRMSTFFNNAFYLDPPGFPIVITA